MSRSKQAMPPALANALIAEVENLARSVYEKTPLVLTPEEVIAGFIHPQHIEKLMEVEELVGLSDTRPVALSHVHYGSLTFSMHLNFGGRAPMLFPRYTENGMGEFAPKELLARLDAWTAERVRMGFAAGLVKDAIGTLAWKCDTIDAVRLLLPCLPMLLARLDTGDTPGRHTQRAQRINELKRVPALPAISRAAKLALDEASSIVSTFSLVADAPIPQTPRRGAALTINGISYNRSNVDMIPDSPITDGAKVQFI